MEHIAQTLHYPGHQKGEDKAYVEVQPFLLMQRTESMVGRPQASL